MTTGLPADWRGAERRRRGEARPGSVRGVVHGLARRLAVARVVESGLIGLGAGCFAVAAGVLSGAAAIDPGLIAVAGLTGLVAGAAWVLETKRSPARVARSLDRRLNAGGALVTAYELERRGTDAMAPLEGLCVERVLDGLGVHAAMHALRPSLVPPVLVPLAGATVLALALESARARTPVYALPIDGLEPELESLGAHALEAWDAERIGGDAGQRLLRLRDEAQALRQGLQHAGKSDAERAALATELERLDDGLAALAPAVRKDVALAGDLERTRARLDALRAGLAQAAPAPASEVAVSASADPQGGLDGTPGSSDSAFGNGAGAGAGGSDSGGAGATGGGSDGTIPTPPPSTVAQGPPASTTAPDPVRGSAASSAWSPADARLVADWVDALNDAAEHASESQAEPDDARR